MKSSILAFAATAISLLMVSPASAGDCEVCVKVMDDVKNGMEKADVRNKAKVEEALGEYCARDDIGKREQKICYYIDPIKRDVAQPFSTGMPAMKVCRRLEKTNSEICAVKFPVKTENMAPKDLSKLRVKQLRSILADRGVECKGCIEKAEFIKKIEATAHLEADL
eukprot:CAMPEP_0195507130 /NCGR_PEP_ID=MMETSP0794_2-20130614/639_1 /TAXON_ID=515487 /ORGANISM="Stephanopyxis turris, Strain CCMP 815" /LENGTH=165 /DNA_ID=CAMNT_0040633703 /DNA_START=76 /DNA_END=573 /DNA_ORIENTATION=-